MGHTFYDLLSRARSRIVEWAPEDVAAQLELSHPPLLIDVRERSEWDEGHLPDAVHIPRGFLEERIEHFVPNHDQPLILYCAGGVRSALAADDLGEMGYRNVASMFGGFGLWKDMALPFAIPRAMTREQHERYSRHTLIPEVGERGQFQLLEAKALLVGAGGLGSPNVLYLAAAGVGTIGVIDSDLVEASNLQRQVIHTTADIGQPKVESAERAVRGLNPDITVTAHNERLTRENVERILEPYDIVVDGGDNFDTRYLINEAAVRQRKTVVSASVQAFEGQLTTIVPGAGPCYRCLFPEPPPPGMAPSCAEAGVLGVVPGVMGMLQATEVLKLILGIGSPLIGRMLFFDALEMTFYEVNLSRDPGCPVCGSVATSADS